MDFQKSFENIDDLFFRSTKQIDFSSSPKALKRRCFGENFCAAGKFLKKQVKKAVFGHFLENIDKKLRFFWGALPLKVSIYIDVEGAFRKIWGSVGQKYFS